MGERGYAGVAAWVQGAVLPSVGGSARSRASRHPGRAGRTRASPPSRRATHRVSAMCSAARSATLDWNLAIWVLMSWCSWRAAGWSGVPTPKGRLAGSTPSSQFMMASRVDCLRGVVCVEGGVCGGWCVEGGVLGGGCCVEGVGCGGARVPSSQQQQPKPAAAATQPYLSPPSLQAPDPSPSIP